LRAAPAPRRWRGRALTFSGQDLIQLRGGELRAGFDAVHAGHADIHEDAVWM